jgi:serine phosphatase RsbU (regulator of sigma subunit)
MALIKIKDGRLAIGGAGMLPALLFRHATAEVEELTLSGAPLGSLTSFAYREREYELSSGDTVLLLSDGFAERFNERDEMYDERVCSLLAKVAHEDSQTIINRFVDEGEAWAGGDRRMMM